jgi:hypothetical protein
LCASATPRGIAISWCTLWTVRKAQIGARGGRRLEAPDATPKDESYRLMDRFASLRGVASQQPL